MPITPVASIQMQPNVMRTPNSHIFLAALLASLIDWDNSEVRQGRRGDYNTTGANSIRLKEIDSQTLTSLCLTLNSLGIDIGESELKNMFTGDYEYQISFSGNRFVSKARPASLTPNEARVVEKVRTMLSKADEDKRDAIAKVLAA